MTRLIKIGITRNVATRVKDLETLAGCPMELLRVFPEQGWIERDLHRALHPSRVIGEWFRPTRDLLKMAAGEIRDLEEYTYFIGPREARCVEVLG